MTAALAEAPVVNQYALYVAGSKSEEARRAKNAYMKARRDAGLEPANGIYPVKAEGTNLLLTPIEAATLEALLKDGADSETIARRVGSPVTMAKRRLTEIQRALGLSSRTELIAEFLHGRASYRIR